MNLKLIYRAILETRLLWQSSRPANAAVDALYDLLPRHRSAGRSRKRSSKAWCCLPSKIKRAEARSSLNC